MKTHRITLPAPIHAAALRGDVSMVLVRMEPQAIHEAEFITCWRWTGGGCSVETSDESTLRAVMRDHAPYSPGDLIACREPWWKDEGSEVIQQPAYRMPLRAVRLWFRVQSVEACRVADVTQEEARAMGYLKWNNSPRESILALWNSMRGHSDSDWTWKLKVERTER